MCNVIGTVILIIAMLQMIVWFIHKCNSYKWLNHVDMLHLMINLTELDGGINSIIHFIIPRETEGYGVERVCPSVRLSVCLSVRPPWHGVVCARELGVKELS